MGPSVHKILIHGYDIIEYLPLPVGQLTEDVLEASHKKVQKHLRLFHAGKTSRMLVSSDSEKSSHRVKVLRRRKPFSKEVLRLLDIPCFLKLIWMEQMTLANI